MVLTSRTQAEALVRISERALDSQVRTAAISRVGQVQLSRFLEAGGLVLEKEGSYYLAAPGYRKPYRWKKAGLVRKRWTT
ncbi:MAG TPA: hypothetical protein VH186_29610 [Chloroflexia bacterium]|nr:hypothetical protein [Chloroflexia bacterium]